MARKYKIKKYIPYFPFAKEYCVFYTMTNMQWNENDVYFV